MFKLIVQLTLLMSEKEMQRSVKKLTNNISKFAIHVQYEHLYTTNNTITIVYNVRVNS